MQTMSDTPETDSVLHNPYQIRWDGSIAKTFMQHSSLGDWVPAHIARRLERERDEARIDAMLNRCRTGIALRMAEEAQAERDTLLAANSELVRCLQLNLSRSVSDVGSDLVEAPLGMWLILMCQHAV
jgi:hypothetical protein